MDNTIAAVLNALNLNEYTHVVVRYRDPVSREFNYVGGGYVSNVVRRFGHLPIDHSYMSDGCLLIYVSLYVHN